MVWGTPVPSRLVGDVIALCGAAGGVLTIVAAARRRGELVLSAFTALMTAATVPVFLAASALLDTPPPAATFSPRDGARHPVHLLKTLPSGTFSSFGAAGCPPGARCGVAAVAPGLVRRPIAACSLL